MIIELPPPALDHFPKKIGVKTLTYYKALIVDCKPARMLHLAFSTPGRMYPLGVVKIDISPTVKTRRS